MPCGATEWTLDASSRAKRIGCGGPCFDLELTK